MINIDFKSGRYYITYKTTEGIKKTSRVFKYLMVIDDSDGKYSNLNGSQRFRSCDSSEFGSQHMFWCLKENKYLDVILQRQELLEDLVTPNLLFYDLETNEFASKDQGLGKGRINSIAAIDYQTGDELVLIKGVDGNEREIIKKFFEYCKQHEIMGLVGYNNFNFDDPVLFNRAKVLNIPTYGLSRYTQCNLDVMELTHVFQYVPKGQYASLQALSEILDLGEGKADTSYYNPVNLYNEALAGDNELMDMFIEYNIQDVRLTVKCFDGMSSTHQLNELFKQTLCPYREVIYNTSLLNCFTCKELYDDNLVVTESVNTKINFKNSGGFNYCKHSNKLQTYENVGVFDVVSYYPHLLMVIGADPTYDYPNINRDTGEIGKFEYTPNGYLAKISKELYDSRAEIKRQRAQYEPGTHEYQQLDFEQLTKKIIVNSLYGVLSQKADLYLLKNELIGATITALGRDVLNHIIKTYGGVYGKTDSVFIPLNGDANEMLEEVNEEVNKYLMDMYNLDNIKNGSQLIRFEVDSVLDKLIVKDKNNYIKVAGDKVKLKGGSFLNKKFSNFERDLVDTIVDGLVEDEDDIIGIAEAFTQKQLDSDKGLDYYSYLLSLSEKSKNNLKYSGRLYMDKHNIDYFYGFKYYACRVEGFTQEYIMFPKGWTVDDCKLYKPFAYEQMCNVLKNIKIVTPLVADRLKKLHHVKKAKNYKVDKAQSTLF